MPFSIQLLTKTPIELQPSQSFGIEFFVNKTGVDPESVTITLRDHNNNILSTRRFDNVTQSFSMGIGNLTAPSKPGTYVFTLEAFNNTTNTLDDSKAIQLNVLSPILRPISLPLSIYRRMPKRMPLSLGFKGYALSFDGIDDYVEVLHNNSFNVDYVTAEAIARVRRLTGVAQHITRKENVWAFGLGLNGHWNGWVHVGGVWKGSWKAATEQAIVNRWYHLVWLYDGSSLWVYINGRKYKIVDAPGVLDKSIKNIYLGIYKEFNTEILNGDIAFLRIYSRVLSEDEIRYNMLNYHNPVRAGLVLWLHDRIVGSNWLDESGNNNNGSITGAIRRNLRAWELRSEVSL